MITSTTSSAVLKSNLWMLSLNRSGGVSSMFKAETKWFEESRIYKYSKISNITLKMCCKYITWWSFHWKSFWTIVRWFTWGCLCRRMLISYEYIKLKEIYNDLRTNYRMSDVIATQGAGHFDLVIHGIAWTDQLVLFRLDHRFYSWYVNRKTSTTLLINH